MSSRLPCPFCQPDPAAVFHEGRLVRGIWDAYPVSPGHALLVTRMHRPTWFDATDEERDELTRTIQVVREVIRLQHRDVHDFNLGVNVGVAAGQTVPHLHLHVIPRRSGDVPDARGGVRNVIPGRRLYPGLASDSPQLLATGENSPLLPLLERELETATQLDIAVAFVMPSGVEKLSPYLEDLLRRGGSLRLVTGDYLDITDPGALQRLLDFRTAFPGANVDVRVFHKPGISFHPKAYVLQKTDTGVAFIGSSNVSSSALLEGIEWNYRIVTSRDPDGYAQVRRAFDSLFAHPAVRPVDDEWLRAYASRRIVPRSQFELPRVEDAEFEPVQPPPPPNTVQQEALAALKKSRSEGYRAGLVVMATGLGKTWLAAFDSENFKRVLFVAHRDEILSQALQTFRRIRPKASFGRFDGDSRDRHADVLFASIATLGRQTHLEGFERESFDYIVVDEFHHAAASTYRRLIEHFRPKFLLGLTATPHRTDGDDLLALCQENLVYECDVVRGIELNLLSTFKYFGVPDTINYENIPWRSSRFDEEALTLAAATRERAENALEQWRRHAGKRTLAFCVSQQHADFMRGYFQTAGVRCAAVHSGPTSDARQGSLDRLDRAELQIVFAVDMFNEGVDLPSIDTVLMLRPTESAILWLQQFGRGLRRKPNGEALTVVDYIGNHRSFLLKVRTLLQLPPGRDADVAAALQQIQSGTFELPPGCSVTYDLRAIEIIRALLRLPRAAVQDALLDYYVDFRERRDVRPTALQTFHDGYKPRSARSKYGSWLRFVDSQGGLSKAEKSAFDELSAFLDDLEVTQMTKSYKMVTLLALLNRDALPGDGLPLVDLANEVRRIAENHPELRSDFGEHLASDAALQRMLEQNPISAWVGGAGTGAVSHFSYEARVFRFRHTPAERSAAQRLIREIVDWRLAEYLGRSVDDGAHYVLSVSHATGRPLLFYPPRHDGLPSGWTPVEIEGRRYEANFVKVALNVVRKAGESANELPAILRGWFGADAGLPGTNHHVRLRRNDEIWRLEPIAAKIELKLELWKSYTREQIPQLFGEQFSQAIWNVGFVVRPTRSPKHMILLVTIDKADMHGDFNYGDHFISPDLFEWQSQKKTAQTDKHGKLIRETKDKNKGLDAHLFVRKQKRDAEGRAAPFIYCGQVSFESWRGNKPITVKWRLKNLLPDRLFEQFRQPMP